MIPQCECPICTEHTLPAIVPGGNINTAPAITESNLPHPVTVETAWGGHPLTLASDCMTATFKSNITRLMATDAGRHQMSNLLHNLIEEVQALAAAASEPDQPEAPAPTTPCRCCICQENLDDSSKMLNEAMASVES